MDKLLRDKKAIIVFIAPAFLLFTFVLFIPICQSVYYSFCDYDALTKPEFIGLENYRQLFTIDRTMKIALKNSMFFLIFSVVTQLIVGLILAALLTNIKRVGTSLKMCTICPACFLPQRLDFCGCLSSRRSWVSIRFLHSLASRDRFG